MKCFLMGLFAAIAGLTIGIYVFLRLGLLNPGAARPPSKFESMQAMKFLDAAIERRAARRSNPLSPSEENLRAGLRIYEAHCALCHGDRANQRSAVGLALYPPAPQFLEDAPDMPEYDNFYIIQNGIRWTGMSAWKDVLDENETWKLTLFLAHINHLPPGVSKEWKTIPSASHSAPSARHQGANRHE